MKYSIYYRVKDFLIIEFPQFIKNIWKFRKALWRHRWYDYSGALHFLEIGVQDIASNVKAKGIEVGYSRDKKVVKMERVVEILTNIREDRYFDIIEEELGRGYNTGNIKFIPYESMPDHYEMVDYDSEEEREFNSKYFERVTELENQQWDELWNILKGQDYDKFDKQKDWDDQFDGSGMRGWWD
jgi:hypothetical protein